MADNNGEYELHMKPGTGIIDWTDMFRRVALARPDIGLQLTHNGRVIHRLPPGPALARVAALMGP